MDKVVIILKFWFLIRKYGKKFPEFDQFYAFYIENFNFKK